MSGQFTWDNPFVADGDDLAGIKVYVNRNLVQFVQDNLLRQGLAFPTSNITIYRKSQVDPEKTNHILLIADELGKMLAVDLRTKPTDDCVIQQQDINGDWIDVFDFHPCLDAVATTIINEVSVEINNQTRNNITVNQGLELTSNVYNNYLSLYMGSAGDIDPDLLYGDADDTRRNEALCKTITDYVNAICDASLQFISEASDEVEDQKLTVAIVSVGLALIGVLGTLATGGGLAIALGIVGSFGIALGLTAPVAFGIYDRLKDSEVENFTDDGAKDLVICAMYNELSGVDLTLEELQGSLLAYPDDVGNVNDEQLAETVHEFNQLSQSHAMFLEKWRYNLAIALLDIPLDADCSACNFWCHEFDFLASDGGWAVDSFGTYSAGIGWKPVQFTSGGNRFNICGLYYSFPSDVEIYNVEATFTATVNQLSIGVTNALRAIDTPSEVGLTLETPASHPTDYVFDSDWSETLDRIECRIYCASKSGTGGFSGANAGDLTLKKIRVYGIGYNPFGSSNC